MIHQRCLTPSTRRNQDGVNAILEILFQTACFFLATSEIVVIDSYSIYKTFLHNLLNLKAKIAKRRKFHKLVNHKLVKFKYY